MKVLTTRNNLQKRRVKKKTRKTKDIGNTELMLGIKSEVVELSGKEVSRNIVVNRLRTALDSIIEYEKRINREYKKIGGNPRKPNRQKDAYIKEYKENTKVRDIYRSFKKIKTIVNDTVEELVFVPIPDDRDNIFDIIDVAKKKIRESLRETMDKNIEKFKDITSKEDNLSLSKLKEKYSIKEGDTRYKRNHIMPGVPEMSEEEKAPKEEDKERYNIPPELELEVEIDVPQEDPKCIQWIPSHHYTELSKSDIIKKIKQGKMSSKGWDGSYNFINKESVESEFTPFPKTRGWDLRSRLNPETIQQLNEFKTKL